MRRHDLVLLNADAKPLAIECCTSDRASVHIERWIAEGRPFVCTRQTPGSVSISLGLAFMDAGAKHRASFKVEPDNIYRVDAPYQLNECLSVFNDSDVVVLSELMTNLKETNLPLRVFGSVSWEIASGEIYRTASSDLDLLCDVASMNELRLVGEEFQKAEKKLSFRLDGEVRFSNSDCVNWREAIQAIGGNGPFDVLVKNETGVALNRWTEWFAALKVQTGLPRCARNDGKLASSLRAQRGNPEVSPSR